MIKEKLYTKAMSDFLGRLAQKTPFTPNGISWFSVALAVAGFFAAYQGNVLIALVLFVLSSGIDLLDGGLARLLRMQTKLGAFIDGALDRFVDFLVLFSFLFFDMPSVFLPFEIMMVILVYFTLMPTFLVAYANHRGAVDDPEEKKVWRIMNRGEMMLLYWIAFGLVLVKPLWSSWLLFLTLILNLITTLQTMYLAIKKSPERDTAFKILR